MKINNILIAIAILIFIVSAVLASGGDSVSNVPIGGTVQGGTAGSVLFVGTTTILQQDNANLFWENGANKFGVGTSGPASVLSVQGATNSTTTLHLGTGGSLTNGSCLQMYAPNGTSYRVFVNNSGVLTTAAGPCE